METLALFWALIMSSTTENLALIVLAAGKGTRMKSRIPKVMHTVAGRPMVDWALAAGQGLSPQRVVVVLGPELEDQAARFSPHDVVIQRERKGTGHAVHQTRDALAGFDGYGLVIFGDTPMATTQAMGSMVAAANHDNAAVVLGVFEREDGTGYGRVMLDSMGAPAKIIEQKDASPDELKISTLNGGFMLIKLPLLWLLLDAIDDQNAQGEYYLTDVLALAYQAGHKTSLAWLDETQLQGVNDRVQLSQVEATAQTRLRTAAMLNGATLVDPGSVTFSFDTSLGADVTVEPNVVFGPGVRVADGATIRAFSHLEQALVSRDCVVGPYARLRPGTVLRDGAKVGNFVEVKNADLGEGAKANHLTYIGDATVGAKANVGAGTITCNYDGFNKARTEIGDGVFVGSNSALVAPVTIGEGAIIAAGSVVNEDVPADALALGRARQNNKEGLAARFRQKAKAKKEAGQK